jgi:hypothetical protein
VVGDDGRDVDVELPAAGAEQQVVQAVAVLADHQQQPRALRQRMEVRVHLELAAHMGEELLKGGHVGQVRRGGEVHPHEEQPRGVLALHVAELLRIDDVAAGLEQQARDGVDDAGLVAAGQGEDVAGMPWDGAVTNRPGARFGPRAIREASHMLCDGTHPLFDVDLEGQLGDAGDLALPNTGAGRHARQAGAAGGAAAGAPPHGLAGRRPLAHAAAAARLPRPWLGRRWR